MRQFLSLNKIYWRTMVVLGLGAVLFSGVMMLPPAVQAAGEPLGTITIYQLNIRSGPDTSYGIVAIARRGEAVSLLGRNTSGSWLKVRLANGQEGWGYTNYIQSTVPLVELPVLVGPQPDPQPNGTVNVFYLNVRSGPGTGYPIVGSLGRGAWLNLLGRNAAGSWLQVSQPGRNPAWVYAAYVSTDYPLSNLPVVGGEPQPGPQPSARVATYRLNFRTGPGLTFPVMANLPRHAQVTLLGRNTDGSWVMVDLGNGQVSWAYSAYLATGYPIMNLPLIQTGL